METTAAKERCHQCSQGGRPGTTAVGTAIVTRALDRKDRLPIVVVLVQEVMRIVIQQAVRPGRFNFFDQRYHFLQQVCMDFDYLMIVILLVRLIKPCFCQVRQRSITIGPPYLTLTFWQYVGRIPEVFSNTLPKFLV